MESKCKIYFVTDNNKGNNWLYRVFNYPIFLIQNVNEIQKLYKVKYKLLK